MLIELLRAINRFFDPFIALYIILKLSSQTQFCKVNNLTIISSFIFSKDGDISKRQNGAEDSEGAPPNPPHELLVPQAGEGSLSLDRKHLSTEMMVRQG